MHSVENRFIAIVCCALLVFVTPLITLFLLLSAERIWRERVQSAEALIEAGAKMLGKPLWYHDTESLGDNARALAADRNVLAVRVYDWNGTLRFQFPTNQPEIQTGSFTLQKQIVANWERSAAVVGRIELLIKQPGLVSRFSRDEFSIIAILLLAVAIVVAAALIGNRITVTRPLMRLMDAIDATRLKGDRQQVDWDSDDEMGVLVRKFNEMQRQLEAEETALLRAHERINAIYNTTPAMLFSVDRNDHIVAVSDYWLMATGFARADVVGRPFIDFIESAAVKDYLDRHERRRAAGICAVTVPFIRADGSVMIVLIMETASEQTSSETETALAVMTDVTALKQAEIDRHQQAITDHLTGLLNRQGFEAALDQSILDATARSAELACLFIDLDRFKWINDNFGHATGDAVLRSVVDRIRAALGVQDRVARLGGDEFAILIDAARVEEAAGRAAARILEAMERPLLINGLELTVSCSIGIALYPAHAHSASDLLLKADMAMYARKRDGKSGSRLFDVAMIDAARQRRDIEDCIKEGLKEDWFEVYLQPIVAMVDGRIVGFEALLRLNHPQKGLLGPAEIVRVAEENGSIPAIGNRVLEKAVRHLARISALEGASDTYMALNLSPLQFEPTFPHRLAVLLLEHHITPKRIVIEITEAVLMLDNPEVHGVLRQLHEFGCRIALDDFGTGYSSLSYLNRFPVDIVKIDQSFIRSLNSEAPEGRRKSRMLIKGIRTIASQMGCSTVAEGVETAQDWHALKKLGIHHGQGYLFSQPLAIENMIELLEQNTEAKETASRGKRASTA